MFIIYYIQVYPILYWKDQKNYIFYLHHKQRYDRSLGIKFLYEIHQRTSNDTAFINSENARYRKFFDNFDNEYGMLRVLASWFGDKLDLLSTSYPQ